MRHYFSDGTAAIRDKARLAADSGEHTVKAEDLVCADCAPGPDDVGGDEDCAHRIYPPGLADLAADDAADDRGQVREDVVAMVLGQSLQAVLSTQPLCTPLHQAADQCNRLSPMRREALQAYFPQTSSGESGVWGTMTRQRAEWLTAWAEVLVLDHCRGSPSSSHLSSAM